MKQTFTISKQLYVLIFLVFMFISSFGQSYLVGPVDPNVGSNTNYTSHNHYDLFDVLNSTGVYLDSITIYPATASTSYTIVVQNSAQVQIASYTGVSTVSGNLPERIKANIFVPFGTGYRLGLTTSSVGMLRNSTGIVYPYTVPNVITFTGSTFQTTYWYFFYNIRVNLPVTATDAAITGMVSPGDSVCSGSQPVSIRIKNNGPSTLTSTTVNWMVNNVPQTPFSWTGSVGLNDSTLVNLGSYNFLTGTTYEITANLSNTNNTTDPVSSNDTITKTGIFVKSSPSGLFTTPNTTICQGDSIVLSGTLTGLPPWSIIVSDGTTNYPMTNIQSSPFSVTLVPTQTKTYTLTSVSDAGGCLTQLSESVMITVMPAPPANITASGPAAFCNGDSVALLGTIGMGFTYEWYKDGVAIPGATLFTITVKEPGAYTVKVTGSTNCFTISAPFNVVVHPLPAVNLGPDTVLLPNQNILLDAGTGFISYLWSTGDVTQTIIVDTVGYGIGVQTIMVFVTDNYGCTGSDTIKVNFTQHPGIAGSDDTKKLLVIPNPSDGNFDLSVAGYPAGEILIEVVGLDGRVLKTVTREIQGVKKQIVRCDFTELPDGMYLLKIGREGDLAVMKIIIRR